MAKNYILPCPICRKSIKNHEAAESSEKPVYCPDCKQIYHHKCWAESGNECKIKGCYGDTKIITTLIEKTLLNKLKIQSELRSECPNCQTSILILYRFCPDCGFEANSPKEQRTSPLFPALRFIHRYKQRLVMTFVFLFLFFFCLPSTISVFGSSSQPTPYPVIPLIINHTQISSPTVTKTLEPLPTTTPKPTITFRPTNTRPPTQISLEPIPASYKCPDKSKIKLQVGASAIIGKLDVNLREQPIVPQVHKANVILILRRGDKVQVIDGPTCSHDGTWWKLKTETGKIGWSREISFGNVLLTRTDK